MLEAHGASSRSLSSLPAKTHRRPPRRNGSDEVVQAADYIETGYPSSVSQGWPHDRGVLHRDTIADSRLLDGPHRRTAPEGPHAEPGGGGIGVDGRVCLAGQHARLPALRAVR